jgi:HNH endonuclease/NUMOD4 motif
MDETSAERWLPIAGYEDYYKVSDFGRIQSRPRQGTKGGVLKPGTKASGHLVVILCANGAKTTRRVHQLVLEAFTGPCPPGLEALHDDGNPANNAWTNLRYGTHTANMRDAVRHGTNRNTAKTHCARGHEFTPENTYTHGNRRACRECALTRACESKRRIRLGAT